MKSFNLFFHLWIRLYILALLFFILLQSQINAEWERPENPLINYSNNRWDSYHVKNPSITSFNGSWTLYYSGNGGSGWMIGSGSSTDLNSWQLSTEPILKPSGSWEKEITQIKVLHEGSVYKAWYSVLTNSTAKLGYATSINGISDWIKYPNPVFTGSQNDWDIHVTERGFSILKISNKYHMWYTGKNVNNRYNIGYATSNDGINWIRMNNSKPINIINDTCDLGNQSYPNVIIKDSKYQMFYATGNSDIPVRICFIESYDGINWNGISNDNPILSTRPGKYDSNHIDQPYYFENNNTKYIFYSGFNGTHWSIGYATASADPIEITPTPTPLEPIVIVPGMMASWNKDGILEGQQQPSTSWKVLPFVKEYSGLMKTLTHLGYIEGQNLFLWAYDWRKPIHELSTRLHSFITSDVKPSNPTSKIHIIGHSQGGLIARAWAQTHADTLHTILTLGTPHLGTIQPYKAWSGGDLSQDNTFLSLAGRIIIELYRRSFTTPREAVRTMFPGMVDLLPTTPFLIRQSDSEIIPLASMDSKNTWLPVINTTVNTISSQLTTISGIGFPASPFSYTVQPASWLDTALGNWKDGKPVSQGLADGDAVIPIERSEIGSNTLQLHQNHSNIIASIEGIDTVLTKLSIPHTVSDITAGQETIINPSLLFLLRSPATLEVAGNNSTYTDTDGIIFIPNASSGTYTVTVIGTATGVYHLDIGQFSGNNYSWQTYTNSTNKGQRQTFTLSFSADALITEPITNYSTKDWIQDIDIQIKQLISLLPSSMTNKLQFQFKMLKAAIDKKDFLTVKKQSEQILIEISTIRKTKPSTAALLLTYAVDDSIIRFFSSTFNTKQSLVPISTINRLKALVDTGYIKKQADFSTRAQNKQVVSQALQAFQEIETYRGKASTALAAEKYITLFLIQILLQEL